MKSISRGLFPQENSNEDTYRGLPKKIKMSPKKVEKIQKAEREEKENMGVLGQSRKLPPIARKLDSIVEKSRPV